MAQRLDVQYVTFRTDGSAARKLAVVQPYKLLNLPKVKKQRRVVVRLDPVALAGIVMSVAMVVMLTIGFVQLQDARQDAAVMESYVQTLREENKHLSDVYEESYDIDSVKITAKALGLVPKEQVKHITIQIPQLEEQKQPGAWEQFFTFLTGLFA